MASGNATGSKHLQHNTSEDSVLFKEEVQTFTVISKDKPVIFEECHLIVQRVAEGERHEMVVIKQETKVSYIYVNVLAI